MCLFFVFCILSLSWLHFVRIIFLVIGDAEWRKALRCIWNEAVERESISSVGSWFHVWDATEKTTFQWPFVSLFVRQSRTQLLNDQVMSQRIHDLLIACRSLANVNFVVRVGCRRKTVHVRYLISRWASSEVCRNWLELTSRVDFCLVTGSASESTEHLSSSSSVFCCLNLPPAAVPVHFSLSRSLFFSRWFCVAVFLCGVAVSTARQSCHRFFSTFVQASSTFHVLPSCCLWRWDEIPSANIIRASD